MLSRKILSQVKSPIFINLLRRNFLSNEYKCLPEWESRLASPIMQKIKLDNMYYEMDQAFNQNGKVSAIDIDLFVNKVNNDTYADEITDLIHRLRITEETTNSLESTSHAVIRNFADHNQYDELMNILDDPLQYGVFLDHYIANYIFDACIKKKNYHFAARISTFLMLQEDFDNKLTQSLALYSCYKYLQNNPQPFYPPAEEKNDEPKEIKVRVKYIRNEYFDDHFDLKNHNHLVGKTLAMIGSQMDNSIIGKNSQLFGQILYEKYEKAIDILKSSKSNEFYKEILEKSNEFLKENEKSDNENYNKLKTLLDETLSRNDLIINKSFEDDITNLINDTIKNYENMEIEKQKKIYLKWNELREKYFNDELKRLKRAERIKEIENITKEMNEEEQKLWFFENEEKINLQIDSKKVIYPKRWFGKKKKPRVIDEGYIPPEVTKQRN